MRAPCSFPVLISGLCQQAIKRLCINQLVISSFPPDHFSIFSFQSGGERQEYNKRIAMCVFLVGFLLARKKENYKSVPCVSFFSPIRYIAIYYLFVIPPGTWRSERAEYKSTTGPAAVRRGGGEREHLIGMDAVNSKFYSLIHFVPSYGAAATASRCASSARWF